MTSVLDIYAPSFLWGKLLWVIPPDMKFPGFQGWRDGSETKSIFKRIFPAIHGFFRVLILAYLMLHFLFLLFRGVVSLNKLRLGEVNSCLEAVSWILASMLPWMTVLVFQTQKSKLKTVLDGLHELETTLIIQRKKRNLSLEGRYLSLSLLVIYL